MLKPQFAKLLWFTSTYATIMFTENAVQVLKPAQYSVLRRLLALTVLQLTTRYIHKSDCTTQNHTLKTHNFSQLNTLRYHYMEL